MNFSVFFSGNKRLKFLLSLPHGRPSPQLKIIITTIYKRIYNSPIARFRGDIFGSKIGRIPTFKPFCFSHKYKILSNKIISSYRGATTICSAVKTVKNGNFGEFSSKLFWISGRRSIDVNFDLKFKYWIWRENSPSMTAGSAFIQFLPLSSLTQNFPGTCCKYSEKFP